MFNPPPPNMCNPPPANMFNPPPANMFNPPPANMHNPPPPTNMLSLHTMPVQDEDFSDYMLKGYHPVHLGDVLHSRYRVFRKLGAGSESTVWLARDEKADRRRYVAVKVLRSIPARIKWKMKRNSHLVMHLSKLLPNDLVHITRHAAIPFQSFVVEGPNGRHLCEVLDEPLGPSLAGFLTSLRPLYGAQQCNCRLYSSGLPPWSAGIARRACCQILHGLDALHRLKIAHRDLHPGNICLALDYNLSEKTENEIQQDIWVPPPKDPTKSLCPNKWQEAPYGNPQASPHSSEWNAANLYRSRMKTELHDSEKLRYVMGSSPLPTSSLFHNRDFRLVVTDLGCAAPFDDCEKDTIFTSNRKYQAPENLLCLPASHAADIFSLGLIFWEIVMLRPFIDQDYTGFDRNGKQLGAIAERLGG
ncbi:kinase-like domain-containing protein [Cercophora newfieldiana]|uniref:non-specific serine/threonine protein kinase n=1 Tax=Cercophora newfieldiana TaxID=92897 RepID=A0AA40CKE3_9PEZI|nr:kinase-like domain-containing protein [Cercophora newfieldiana]